MSNTLYFQLHGYTKFYYQHNTYIATNIIINILLSTQTEGDLLPIQNFVIYFQHFKLYVHLNVSNVGSHNTQICSDCTLCFYKLV
jgi:hypothetical protein